MKLSEAIALLEQGKKVRRKNWDPGIYLYRSGGICVQHLDGTQLIASGTHIELTADWEEYIPTVTFFEAMRALEAGKRVRHMQAVDGWYFQVFNGEVRTCTTDARNGVPAAIPGNSHGWLILD